jgi:hypothetical protein
MMKKSIYTSVVLIGMLFFIGTTAQAQTWMAKYYEKNPMSLDQVTAAYGSPLNTIDMADGVKKMVFGPKAAMVGYTYFLIKDGMAIDKNVTDTLGKKGKTEKYAGPTPKTFMANYYKSNPMSVEALTAKWGKSASNIDYDNGITKMTFGPKHPEVGYIYFLIKDGMVVDKNSTDTLEKKSETVKYAGPTPKTLMANYYKSNPMSVDELTAKWGNPVSNHEYDNGIKKLTFGPKDVMVGYTYFLTKDGMVVDKNVTGAY